MKLETVVQRLKEHELLTWDNETQRYRVSPLGRKALAAVSTLLEFEHDDDDGLGYITAQLAAGQAVGRVSADELAHLLSRLSELKEDFDRAVLSGSEHRIRRAAQRLDSVWTWVEKGTEVVSAITDSEDLDSSTHRLAQAVGRAQSALLRQAGIFQRELNKIDQHRVHLGRTGLSSSDLVGWLRSLTPDALAQHCGRSGHAADPAALPAGPDCAGRGRVRTARTRTRRRRKQRAAQRGKHADHARPAHGRGGSLAVAGLARRTGRATRPHGTSRHACSATTTR